MFAGCLRSLAGTSLLIFIVCSFLLPFLHASSKLQMCRHPDAIGLTQQRLTFGKHKGKTFKEALQTTLTWHFWWRELSGELSVPKIMEDDFPFPKKMAPKGWFRRWIHGQPYCDADLSSHFSYLGQEKEVRIPTMGEYIVRCTYVYCRISFVKHIHVCQYAHECYVYM